MNGFERWSRVPLSGTTDVVVVDVTTFKNPAFPPNRVIREGEATCAVCASGRRSHAGNGRGHAFVKWSRQS